jgi:hypothetical protein
MSKDTKEAESIISRNYGLDLLHPAVQPPTRFKLAQLAIAGDLTTGRSDNLADGLRRTGYDPEEFWEDFLSEPASIDDFILSISSFHFSPSMNGVDLIKMTLHGLLKQAARTGEPFILKAGMIDPRGAVIWLLSMRLRRALIPVELARHVEDGNTAVEMQATATAKEALSPLSRKASMTNPRGPRPYQMPRVLEEMRRESADRLASMKLEEMRVVFRASRDTCEKARRSLLSEIVDK